MQVGKYVAPHCVEEMKKLTDIAWPLIREMFLEEIRQWVLGRWESKLEPTHRLLSWKRRFYSKLVGTRTWERYQHYLSLNSQIWVIECSQETAIQRMKGRGFTEEEAKLRISSQWKNEDREKFADVVIVNNGSREELESQVNKYFFLVFSKLKTQSNIRIEFERTQDPVGVSFRGVSQNVWSQTS